MLSPSAAREPKPAVAATAYAERQLILVPSPKIAEASVGQAAKRLFDVVAAATLIVALSPLFLVLACLIKVTSRGPVVFRQRRVGQGSREFRMYKFRSMCQDAHLREDRLIHDERYGCFFKLKGDTRVTPVGKWLRRLSLDELPQLWNVVNGDMSLVGPRPLLVGEFEKTPALASHCRFRAKPGLTGLWQVSGRSNCSDEERLRLDAEYTQGWSFFLDMKILAKTFPVVVSGDGAY